MKTDIVMYKPPYITWKSDYNMLKDNNYYSLNVFQRLTSGLDAAKAIKLNRISFIKNDKGVLVAKGSDIKAYITRYRELIDYYPWKLSHINQGKQVVVHTVFNTDGSINKNKIPRKYTGKQRTDIQMIKATPEEVKQKYSQATVERELITRSQFLDMIEKAGSNHRYTEQVSKKEDSNFFLWMTIALQACVILTFIFKYFYA